MLIKQQKKIYHCCWLNNFCNFNKKYIFHLQWKICSIFIRLITWCNVAFILYDIYCYCEIKWLILWCKILVIFPTQLVIGDNKKDGMMCKINDLLKNGRFFYICFHCCLFLCRQSVCCLMDRETVRLNKTEQPSLRLLMAWSKISYWWYFSAILLLIYLFSNTL